jgi:hypothetical protein
MPVCVVAQGEQQQPAEHVQHYRVTDLGTLEGGTFSQPFFINRDGLVSGSSSLPDGTQHAALWLEELKVDIRIPTLKIFADSVPTSPVYLSCGRTGE